MKYPSWRQAYEQVLKEDGHVQSENVKNQLTSIKRNSEQLLSQIQPDVEYPSWWVNKLVKAEDYLDTAKDFLQNKIDQKEEVQEIDEAPLVMGDMDIIRSILTKLEKDFSDLISKKQLEKGWPKLQMIAKAAGYGVSKEKQKDGKTYRYDLKK